MSMQQVVDDSARRGAAGESSPVDVLIVGAGPVGLFAAYYAGLRGLTVAVLDSLPEPGGQITALYPEKQILDVAAHPAISGRELVAALLTQASAFAPTYLLGDSATRLAESACDGVRVFDVAMGSGRRVSSRAIVIAGGIGTFTARPLPAAEQWPGTGVDYLVRDPAAYAGRRVVVVGGGDTAVDWALALAAGGAAVTLVHRTARFRAHPASVEGLPNSGVDVRINATVVRIEGRGRVEAIVLREADGEHRLGCDAVVPALGYVADLRCFADWGIEMTARHIRVDSMMRTTRPGVYAAGDIVDYPGKVRLIAVGFGEAATAVNNAASLIYPGLSVFPGHSTDRTPARTND
jgi:thioredoxin reductase (NADPH)